MKEGATDWRKGEALTLATWQDENIDIHHIFPRRWCEEANPKIPPGLYDSIINKTPIDARTNKMIGRRAPSVYLPRLGHDNDQLDKVLESHWVAPDLLRNDEFARCFVERGEKMLQLIGRAMGKPIPGGREVFQKALTSAGFVDEFDQPEDEHDVVGERNYDDD